MLSRPCDNGHTPFGDIFYSESPDLCFWGRHRHVMGPVANSWQSTKVGGGPVPIETPEGWLLVYHGVLTSCNGFVYSAGRRAARPRRAVEGRRARDAVPPRRRRPVRVRRRRPERRLPVRDALRRATPAGWRSTTAPPTPSPDSRSPTSTSSSSSRKTTPSRLRGDRRARRDGRKVGANAYGYFDEAAREYVITRPDTPTPWINYLGEGRYGGIVSNTGGGYSFDRDPRHWRVSRYRYNARSGRPARPLRLPPRPGDGRVLERDLAAGQAAARRVRVPSRRRLHAHRGRARRDRLGDPLLRPAGRGRRELAVRALGRCGSGTPATARAGCAPSATSSSASPTRSSTSRTSTGRSTSSGSRFEDGVILAGTVFRPQTTFFASSVDAGSASTPTARRSSAAAATWRARSSSSAASPTNAGSPRGNSIGSLCHELELAPGRGAARSSSCSASPATSRRDRRVRSAFRDRGARRGGVRRRSAPTGTRYLVALHRRDARPGAGRDGQLLEPGPVPDDAALVALRLRPTRPVSAAAWAPATRRRTRSAPCTRRPGGRARR